MTIKCVRLSTGEDIIGDVSDAFTADDPVIIKNPAQIVVRQTETGGVGAAFAPFAPFAKDNTVKFYSRAIIGEIEIDINLVNEYNRIFGSGIVVATADQLPR
jgi:hypothetical protein